MVRLEYPPNKVPNMIFDTIDMLEELTQVTSFVNQRDKDEFIARISLRLRNIKLALQQAPTKEIA